MGLGRPSRVRGPLASWIEISCFTFLYHVCLFLSLQSYQVELEEPNSFFLRQKAKETNFNSSRGVLMSLKMKVMEACLAVLFVLNAIRSSAAVDTISQNRSISERETIVSAGEGFELGFFSPGSSTNLYLGIWYKKISVGNVVWVANRETPLTDGSGVLKLTEKGILVLLNSTEHIVWSSNSSRKVQNPVAQLLISGNLVIRDESDENPENYVWQSFDYPCDTMLPDMKIGRNSATGQEWFLSSWKSADDPAPGDYSVRLDTRGSPQLVVRNGSSVTFRAGPWNGLTWSGTPALQNNPVYIYFFMINGSQITHKYEIRDQSFVSKIVIQPSGSFARFTWIKKSHNWMLFFESPTDQCDTYGFCGAYGLCNINTAPPCTCLKGFVPKSPKDWDLLDWTNGCVRKTPLNCHDGGSGDGFLKITGIKLPDTTYSWVDRSIGLQECKDLCSRNCSCTAYANSNINGGGGGSGCLLWFTELVDIKEFNEDGQDIYVRLAASELDGNKRKKPWIITGSVIGVVIAASAVFLCLMRKKKLGQKEAGEDLLSFDFSISPGAIKCELSEGKNPAEGRKEVDIPLFRFSSVLAATDDFSPANKLGEGGFGPVYKGKVLNGHEIAVKRLSRRSGQGLEEFKNEATVIGKLQHKNLVKLLGCCIEGDEKILIYEYLPNKSLDRFLFGPTKHGLLDWGMRVHIIEGIAQGLLYLHQFSRLQIIHRDLKTGNILLDEEMNPKISDFGMARIFGGKESQATNRIVGTYGYMSPEYALEGIFSVKSDVFSFGVLLLEILSGKKNTGFYNAGYLNLLGYAWDMWISGRAMELVDPTLEDSPSENVVLRFIKIGLLCVQESPFDRPTMSDIVSALGNEAAVLPPPKQPAFSNIRSKMDKHSLHINSENRSVNNLSISILGGR